MRIQRVHMRPEVESKRAAIISQSDVFGRHHYLDGRLDLAIGCWDKVADRRTLNRSEAQFPLAKENTQARVCSASMPPSPKKEGLNCSHRCPRIRSTLRIYRSHVQRALRAFLI